jgi:hypothetical protein
MGNKEQAIEDCSESRKESSEEGGKETKKSNIKVDRSDTPIPSSFSCNARRSKTPAAARGLK